MSWMLWMSLQNQHRKKIVLSTKTSSIPHPGLAWKRENRSKCPTFFQILYPEQTGEIMNIIVVQCWRFSSRGEQEKDLKGEIETWTRVLWAYEFSKRQLEIMKYFNARYENLDARDDYSAKHNKEGQDEIKYSGRIRTSSVHGWQCIMPSLQRCGILMPTNGTSIVTRIRCSRQKEQKSKRGDGISRAQHDVSGWLDPQSRRIAQT